MKPRYGDRLLCTKVTYRNTGDTEASFNPFDWKIQDPAGVQASPTYSGGDDLQSGQLAPGGTVAGDVCVDDPGAKGDYLIINTQVLADQIQWAAKL